MNTFENIGQTLTRTQLCTIYHNAISRCYSEAVHRNQPYYIGCTMSPVWYNPDADRYQRQDEDPYRHAFYDWVRSNYYRMDTGEPIELDKDIKVPGNAVYAPETCLFVPRTINTFFGGTKGRKNAITDAERSYLEGRRDSYLETYYGRIPQEVYNAIQAYEF